MSAALTTAELESWLGRYGAAWEGRDADAAAALFTDDALYYETPYADPFDGAAGVREYWRSVTEDQRDVDFKSNVIAVTERKGIAQWSAAFSLASNGAAVELNGMFLLTFADDGRCSELREWWHAR